MLYRYPFDVNKSPIHEMAYVWVVTAGCFVMFGIIGFDMLFVFLTMHVVIQFYLLKIALKSINFTKDPNCSTEHDEESVYKELIFCINHHIKLVR